MIARRPIAATLCVAIASVAAVTIATRADAQETFAIGGGQSVAAEAGAFSVPFVRSQADSPAITLRFVRFRSTSATPGPPIVFLAGGPGDAATRAFHGMPRAVLESLTALGDVIAFDQRGTGTSEPSNVLCAPRGGAPLDAPFDPAQFVDVMGAQLTSCLDRTPVAGFTTVESADDVAALAKAIGAPQVFLLAGSYGTHLALAVARQHPGHVAGMALLGVEGPGDTLKLPARVDEVLAAIDAEHPGTIEKIRTLVSRLRESPWTKTLPNGQRVTVGAWDLQRRIADALDTVPEITALLSALDPMMAGDYSDLVRFAIPFRSARPINLMHIATDCASYATRERLAAISEQTRSALLGDAINFPMPALCSTPGLPRLGDDFRAPLTSDVPALFVAGTFDGRTPPANAAEIAKGFTRAEVEILPGASHSLFQDARAMAAVRRLYVSVTRSTSRSLR